METELYHRFTHFPGNAVPNGSHYKPTNGFDNYRVKILLTSFTFIKATGKSILSYVKKPDTVK